jgi:hypothetical protein
MKQSISGDKNPIVLKKTKKVRFFEIMFFLIKSKVKLLIKYPNP